MIRFGLDGGLNTFGYVSGNPVRYIDNESLKINGRGGLTYEIYTNNESIRDCVIGHEEKHLSSARARGFNGGCANPNKKKGTIAQFPTSFGYISEILAYRAELRCLETKLRDTCKNDGCRDDIERMIRNVKAQIVRFRGLLGGRK